MRRILTFLPVAMALLAGFTACGGSDPASPVIIQPGDINSSTTTETTTLEAWTKGYLDIHYINTGRGECSFLILPDGTQMLVDCGASIMKYDSSTNLGYPQVGIYPKPDDSQVAGYWYTEYIKKLMEWTGNDTIDYGLSTHFDGDHLGVGYTGYGVTPPTSPYGNWIQTGFTYLLDNLKFGKMVDHGYPDYDYPYTQTGTVKSNCDNYRRCAEYHEKNTGLKREIFVAGSNSQFVLKKDAASYPTFKIQNVFVNGVVWSGTGTSTTALFPDKSTFQGSGAAKEASPSENSCSAVIKLSYGKFDYYSGGDAGFNGASTYSWKHVEKACAKVVGKVEVMKATHHGSTDGCSQDLIDGLNPSDIIINVWQAVQPRKDTYERLKNSTARLYTTNINDAYMKTEYSDKGSRFSSTSGHIVVRVAPGGDSYTIYVLDDTDTKMQMKIKSSFGPFTSK